jgi:hypothetical protein
MVFGGRSLWGMTRLPTNPLLMGARVADLDVINLSAEPLDREAFDRGEPQRLQVADIVVHDDG